MPGCFAVEGIVFRKILLSSCFAVAIAWLAWSIFVHIAFPPCVEPRVVPVGRAATTGYVRDTSDATFNQDVLSAQQPVLVDFYATWCGPCQIMAPVVEELSAQYKGTVRFLRVDVDKNPGLATKYQIQSIPALKMFYRGKVVDGVLGVTEQPVLREKIDRVITLGGMNNQ